MIEIVDSEERINRLVALLQGMPEIGLMILETVRGASRPPRAS
jgi:PII-like signaling protein